MSSATTYLAAAAALGAASEATGTTALTPLGQSAREDDTDSGGGGGGINFPAPDRGNGVSGDVLAQLADAFQGQQQAGPDPLELLELAQQGNGAADQLRAALEDQRERTEELRDEYRRRLEAAQEGDLDGDGNSDVPGVPGTGGDDSSSDDQDTNDDPERYDSATDVLLNPGTWADDQKDAFPTVLGTPGRGAKDSEGVFGAVYDYGQATRAGYDEFAGAAGDSWDDLKGRFNSDAGDDAGSSSDGGQPDVIGLGGGLDAINLRGNSFGPQDSDDDSSSSDPVDTSSSATDDVASSISLPSSDEEDEEDLSRRTRAAVDKIRRGRTDQIGGL